MSYGNISVTVKCEIQLVEIIIFNKATVVKNNRTWPDLARPAWLIKGRAKARPGPMDATPLHALPTTNRVDFLH